MLGTGTFLVLSLLLFVCSVLLIAMEKKRDKRFFLVGVRSWLDTKIDEVANYILQKLVYLGRHTIKLSWYYSIHKALRLVLTILVKAYDSLEVYFMHNKARARTIKLEKKQLLNSDNHLGQMAEHKVQTALTEGEKKKLLRKKLERG